MKRNLLIFTLLCVSTVSSFAGGIMTNTNQSAAYVRLLARDATLGIDAVYFNPAGLTMLNRGLYFSVSNQSIWQNRKIVTDYTYLNNKEYKGAVTAPLFPSVYAAYKFDTWALSLGINPIGGGGGATYDNGLPSFEYGISDLVPYLKAAGQPVTAYSADINFKGSSVYWGAQLGASAEIDEHLSVFLGMRYVNGSTTYTGYLHDISLTVGGNPMLAKTFFEGAQAQYQAGSQQAAAAAANFGGYPAAMVMPDNVAIAAGLPTGTTFGQAAVIMTQASATYAAKAVKAGLTSQILSDQNVDVTQKGQSVTPIFGLNLNLLDKKLNIGLKYELPTFMKMKNHTDKDALSGFTATGDSVTLFPDGQQFYNDMPAMLSLGATYQLGSRLMLSAGYHTYWDKQANYGKKSSSGEFVNNEDFIKKNYNEYAIGLECKVYKSLLVSAGYLRAETGVKEEYQTDLSNSLTSNSVGFGFAFNINPKVQINLGGLYTQYLDSSKTFNHTLPDGTTVIPITETYSKGNVILAIGADISLGKK